MLSVDEAHLLERSLPAAVAQPDAEVVVVDNALHRPHRDAVRASTARGASRCASAASLRGGDQRRPRRHERRRRAAAQRRLLPRRRASWPPRDRGSTSRGVGSVAPLLLRATGMEPADRLDVVDAAGMTIDRRRKNSLVGHGEPRAAHARRREVFGGDGACVLYRRETLNAIAVGAEVFDEDMALWASDADVAWRARDAGWRCGLRAARRSPGTCASTARATAPLLAPEHRRLQFRNRLLMIAKNETGRGFARNAPWILGYEVLALGHALLRERTLLPGYATRSRLLPGGASSAAGRPRRPPTSRGRRPPTCAPAAWTGAPLVDHGGRQELRRSGA